MNQVNPFVQIYGSGGWLGKGSGHGSTLDYTQGYRDFLSQFIHYNRIQSIVDFGCGDWTFSSHVNWHGASYLGLDCVPEVIQANQLKHERGNVRFKAVEFGDFTIPPCDLLIAKDMLQHLSNRSVIEFLENTRDIKYVLLTNDFAWGDNTDTPDGKYRRMDLTKPPFSKRGQVIYSFESLPDDKIVFLLNNG